MPITAKKQLGDLGETIATNYLKNKNYRIIALNYANTGGRRLGEIDIIAKDPKKDEFVFVEVKAREYTRYRDTLPEENVNYHKMRKLEKIAYFYLREKNHLDHPYRFDVISVWIDETKRMAKIKHLKSI